MKTEKITLSSWQLTNESANRKNTHTTVYLYCRVRESKDRDRYIDDKAKRSRIQLMKHHPQLLYTNTHTAKYNVLNWSFDSNSGCMETHIPLLASEWSVTYPYGNLHSYFYAYAYFYPCICVFAYVSVGLCTSEFIECLCSQSHRHIFPKQYNKIMMCILYSRP